MNNLKKRCLTLLLSLAMIITYMPNWIFAYAVDGQGEPAAVEEVVEEPAAELTEEASTEEAVTQKAEESDADQAPNPAPAKEDADDAPQGDTLEATSDNYKVTVTYGADAKIPEGAKLRITEFAKGSDEYEAAKKELLKDTDGNSPFSEFDENASDEDLEGLGMAAFDLTIYDKDGNPIEPDKDSQVRVNVELIAMPEDADAKALAESMEIQHLNESSGNIVVEKVATVDGAEAAKSEEVGKIEVKEKSETAEVEFTVSSFSTYTVTWGGYGGGSATVHYGYMNGNQFVEFANGIPPYTPSYNGNYAFLIYDVPGYEYDSTHLNSATGTSIRPILNVAGNNHQYTTSTGNGTASWTNFSNGSDIYVVYKAKTEPTQGGNKQTIDPTQETWPSEIPSLVKSSTNNGNGTNKISLRITGPEKVVESGGKADIIVVFDRSGSMSTGMSGSTRLQLAKDAINGMVDELMSTENDNIRMGLVQFSTTGSVVQNLTGNPATMKSAVNGLSAEGGTNWEQALNVANHMSVESDRPTFVVFITDGDPTFRMSRGEVTDNDLDMFDSYTYRYYRQNQVFGTGSSDNSGRNFDFAVEEVKNIAGANKQFYAIGVSNDVAKVQSLCSDAGVDTSHAFLAADSDDLTAAFEDIIAAIQTKLGYGDIKINDGITSMTSVEMKALQEIDPESFTYYRYGGENNKYGNGYANKTVWTAEQMAAEKCEPATYAKETGDVKWDMGDDFQLENGVTYVVEFEAWPSQEAYDIVADLNNGIKSYDSLPAETRAQIKKLDDGTYTLMTNVPGSVGATYAQTHKTGDDVTVTTTTGEANYTETIENLTLDEETIGAVKEWKNELDSRTREGVTLIVNKDGAEYLNDPAKTAVSEDNNWTVNNIFISCGFIKQEGNPLGGGAYEVKEVGHDYTIDEPDDLAYYWDLESEDYRPMAINGIAHLLVQVDEAEDGWVDGKDYYVIENKIYKVDDQHNVLKAVNDRRSVLDVVKSVTGDNVPDSAFDFTMKVVNSNAASGSADNYNSDHWVWFSIWDTKAGAAVKDPDAAEATNIRWQLNDAEYDENGKETKAGTVVDTKPDAAEFNGYFAVPSGTNITVHMKDGYSLRFLNLPKGSTYEITESSEMPEDGFTFDKIEGTRTYKDENDQEQVETGVGTISGQKISGTIEEANSTYKATYTNKWATTDVKVKKVDEKNAALNGAEFKLERSKDKGATWSTVMDSFSPVEGKNPFDLGGLGIGLYKMTETKAPTGYVKADPVYFLVTKSTTGEFSVSLADESGTPVEAVDGASIAFADDAYTITVEDPRERGNLKVTKKVDSKLAADKQKDFSFTVTLSDTTISGTFGDVSFTNGIARFTLKDGEVKNITGLPTGITYTVAEATATGFVTTKTGDEGTITTTESTAAFTNKRETGDLEVSKAVVSDLAADKTKEFNFTVTLDDTSISGTFGDMTFTSGIATFTLKDGEKKTATGLPTTVGYTVTEAAEGGFTTTPAQPATGTITTEKSTEAFTNTRDTGDLDVTKTVVSSTNADKTKDFTFTVTLSDTSISKTYGTGANAVTFTNGVATFTLKHGQTKSITGLPVSVGYTVTEATADGFITTKTGETGTISATKATAAFTNSRDEGGLVVSKSVVSDVEADKTKDFEFTVTLSDTSINETYGTGANAVTFTNGVATFTLKDGESKNISGLPKGITYTVVETADDDFVTTKTGDTGEIGDEASTAAFTNTRKTGKLTISKTVVSDAAADKKLAFTFTIKLQNGEQLISGTYSGVTFGENGEGTITLKGGESKDIEGLPVGTTYTVTEAAATGFVTDPADPATGTITTKASKADFTNTREVGNLEVTKTVESSTTADKQKAFSFTVTLSDETIEGTYGGMEFTGGVATFTLKDGESKKAEGLPTGVTYTVTETADAGFDTTQTGDSGTIVVDGSTAAFTNARKEGGLTVKKTVASDVEADKTKDFTFTIELSDKTINETYSGVEFKNGIAELTLQHGGSKTIEGLPAGITYTVTETADDNFTTTYSGETGTISEAAATASFTNTRKTGPLTISKTVVSDAKADKDQEFTFTIKLQNGEQLISGTYSEVTFDENGEGTITLKGGENKTIEGLPIGTTYTVTEAEVTGFTTGQSGDTGTITEEASAAAFTNTRETGDLEVSKTVVSDKTADKNVDFTFTVTLSDDSITGTYGEMEFTAGVATFTLKDGESKKAEGLPTDITYTVTEAADNGFDTTKTGDTGTISTTKSEAEFTNTRKTGELTVRKTVVSSTTADKQKEFSFTVTMTGAPITGTYGEMEFTGGIAEFTLKDGQELTAEGLPTSVEYTVTEETAAGFITTKTGDTGTISETAAEAAFTNSRDEGGLIVSKSVVSDVKADKTKEFEFTVTLSDTSINETYGTGANAVTFTNGVATFKLKDGETKNITGLPKGITYTVVETADGDFVTTKTGDTGTISAEAATAEFTNTRKVGDLTVSKTVVSDAAADKDQIFTFTIKLQNGDQLISGTYSGVTFDENGEGTITLKDGGSQTIEGLPIGTTYTVTEATADGFDTTQSGDTGTITEEAASAAAFTNTRKVGDLELSKVLVSDLAADKDQEFTFTITLSDTTINKTYSGVEFRNGVATVELKGGAKKLIEGLPTGVTYTITEADVEGFEVTGKTGDTGTISTTKSEAEFTNSRLTGTLELSKVLVSERTADADQEFTFTVTLTGAPITGTYGGMTFKDGVATVVLKGGAKVAATGLPTDAEYTITEASATGFKLTGKTGDTGTISTTKSEAEFTNTRETGELELSKVLVSDLAADKDQDFTFTVTLTGAPITGTYGDMTFNDGVATVVLKGGEDATAVGLPTDVAYTITEASVDGIVNTGKTGDTGTISTTKSKASFTNTREVGDLEVTKTVVSTMAADKRVNFDFTVTLSDTSISGKYGDMTFKDGVATFQLQDGESKTATGLPTTVGYTVTEDDSAGFTTTKTGDTGVISTEAAGKAEFTNTAKLTEVTVNKIWKDNDNKEELRPEEGITVHLIATVGDRPIELPKEIVTVQTLTEDNADPADANKWTYTWENLPLRTGGELISYRVVENPVEGYETTIVYGAPAPTEDGSQVYTVQITNTLDDVRYVADTPEMTIVKKDQDGKALEGVEFTLTNPENGEEITVATGSDGIATIEIPQNEKWLPVDERVADKTEYTFTLTETAPTGYEPAGPWDVNIGLKVNEDGKVYKYTLKVDAETDTSYWERFIEWIISGLSGDPAGTYTWDGTNLGLTVTNKAAKQAIEVTKTYEGLEELPEGFAIDVEYIAYGTSADEDGNIETTTKTLTVEDATVDGNTLTWTIDDVRFGSEVTATESGYEAPGYGVENTYTTHIKDEDETEPAEGTTATIDRVPAGEEEGEIVGNINFTNIYTHINLEINKTIDKIVSYDEDAEVKDATFTFRVIGKDAEGNVVLNTIAAVMFNASTGTSSQAVIEMLPPNVETIEVTEIDSGNYVSEKINVEEMTEENYTKIWTVSFNNTQNGNDYESGAINRYEKDGTGYVKAGSGGAQNTEGGAGDSGQN